MSVLPLAQTDTYPCRAVTAEAFDPTGMTAYQPFDDSRCPIIA